MNKKSLYYVLIALILGVLAGFLSGTETSFGGVALVQVFGLIGKLFLNALSLVVVPLVSASVITGSARMAADGSFRTLGLKTLAYFISTTTIAVLLGFTFGIVMEPGKAAEPLTAVQSTINFSQQSPFDALTHILTQVIPHNIVDVLAKGQILGIIVFSLVVGIIIPQINPRHGEVVLSFAEGILEIMMRITRLVIKMLPIGVFGLVAKVVAEVGAESLGRAAWFFATTIAALSTFAFILLPILLFTIGKVNPFKHIQAMLPAMLTGFTTSSSVATLPISIDCLEKRAGISNRLATFVMPLGASLNMCGSAIYIVIAVLTVAQSYGIDLPLSSLALLILTTILVATGEAGIPSVSLIAIMMILQTLNLPPEGIGLALIVDRVLDMCRTPVTILTNSCCAVFVARYEEKQIAKEVQPA